MTITIDLPEYLQRQTEALAEQRGESIEETMIELLTHSIEIYAGELPSLEERRAAALPRIREMAAERGLEWDVLSQEAREQLINDLLHD